MALCCHAEYSQETRSVLPQKNPPVGVRSARNRSRRGAELIEFTLVMLPMLALSGVLLNVSWGVFTKSTIQRAVRLGVRRGVTLTADQLPDGSDLTTIVKDTVQQNAMGMLAGDSRRQLIKVHYFKPPGVGSTDPVTDVSGDTDGNAAGNIMQVGVENYSLIPLVPMIFSFREQPVNNPLVFSVYSADRIEPTRNQPPIGQAP